MCGGAEDWSIETRTADDAAADRYRCVSAPYAAVNAHMTERIYAGLSLIHISRDLASVLLSFLVRGGDQAQLARLEVGNVKRHSGLIGMGMDDILAAGAV